MNSINRSVSINGWRDNSYIKLLAVQGEPNGRTLTISCCDDSGVPINLTESVVQLNVHERDLISGDIINAQEGIVRFALTPAATRKAGTVGTSVLIMQVAARTGIEMPSVTLEVQASHLEHVIQSEAYIALLNAYGNVSAAVEACNKATVEAVTQASGAQAAKDAANAATQNCTEKTNLCTAATRECESVTQSCEEAAAYAQALRAPTVSVGLTETVEPGKPAQAVNVGTEKDPVINFQIPKGEPGLYQMVNPITGKTARIDDVINSIYSYFIAPSLRPITAEEYDNLALPAENYDSRKLEAFEYDMKGKLLLVGGT